MPGSLVKSDEFEIALAENLISFEKSTSPRTVIRRPKVVCLGESHGSHLFAMNGSVLPGTGSLLLRLPHRLGPDILLDPGWGTIASARRLELSLTDVGCILISHCHLDHTGDLHPLLLTLSLSKKQPLLIANSTSIKGGPAQPSVLPDYFRNLCKNVVVGEPLKSVQLGAAIITPFSTRHRENPQVAGESLGYILKIGKPVETQLAFVTDGPLASFSPSVMLRLRECRVLVINLGTLSALPNSPSHSKTFDNALCLHGLEKFISDLGRKPTQTEVVALTHLGAELLEVRSPSMKRFLAQAGYSDLVSLMRSVLRNLVASILGKGVKTRVLLEGDELEV